MPTYPSEISYSDKFYDQFYEYRNVTLPKQIYKQFP
jgi:cyclin-dependent kinase regulatory subunit CKS1